MDYWRNNSQYCRFSCRLVFCHRNGYKWLFRIHVVDILCKPQISTEASDLTCFGASNGSIDVIIINGNNSYSYSWNDPASQSTPTATNLSPGVYTVTATDVFGCELIASDSVTQPDELIVNILSSTLCSPTDIAKVEVEVDGGIMPYQFLWNTTDVTSVIYVVDGNYSIDVTDANSCVTTQSAVVEPYYPITITYQTSPASCIDNNDGLIVISAAGGYTPYTYEWSHGALDSIINVSSGEYSLTIIDKRLCRVEIMFCYSKSIHLSRSLFGIFT